MVSPLGKMALRQSKRPLTFLPRPLGDMFCTSEGLIQSGTRILSYCDDSFAMKLCPPIGRPVPGRTLPITAAGTRDSSWWIFASFFWGWPLGKMPVGLRLEVGG